MEDFCSTTGPSARTRWISVIPSTDRSPPVRVSFRYPPTASSMAKERGASASAGDAAVSGEKGTSGEEAVSETTPVPVPEEAEASEEGSFSETTSVSGAAATATVLARVSSSSTRSS